MHFAYFTVYLLNQKSISMKTEKPQLPWEDGTACIIYKPQILNIFLHIDFVNRWFKGKLINISKIENPRSNYLIDSNGIKFTFRLAQFKNFNKIKNDSVLTIVEKEGTGDVWIMKPQWMTETKLYTDKPVSTYEELLRISSLFSADGELMKRLIKKERIKEILK